MILRFEGKNYENFLLLINFDVLVNKLNNVCVSFFRSVTERGKKKEE